MNQCQKCNNEKELVLCQSCINRYEEEIDMLKDQIKELQEELDAQKE